jgi:hypothetical protein
MTACSASERRRANHLGLRSLPAALAGALGAQLPVVPAPQRVALAEGRVAVTGLSCTHAAFAPRLEAFPTFAFYENNGPRRRTRASKRRA